MPLLEQIQGRELPGASKIRAPYMVFRSQTKNWPKLAREYQDGIVAVCEDFLAELIGYAWPTRMQSPLQELVLHKKLETMRTAARLELRHLETDKHELQPFDEEYEDMVQMAEEEAAKAGKKLTEAERVVEEMIAYHQVRDMTRA